MGDYSPRQYKEYMEEETEDEDEEAFVDENIRSESDHDVLSTSEPRNTDKFVFEFDLVWNQFWCKPLIVLLIVCTLVFIAPYLTYSFNTNKIERKTAWPDIVRSLKSKQQKFPSQDITLWSGISSGLLNLEKKPIEPAVYLLAFDRESMPFASCIVDVIITFATKLMQPSESETRKWLLLNGTTLSESSSEDPGDLIDVLNEQMAHSRIVVVTDVEKIPAKLARGFHSMVDTYEVMSKKDTVGAVYVFTMMVPSLDDSSAVTKLVEDILLAKWKDLDRDELQPLVTRISNLVLPVTKEQSDSHTCQLKIDSTIEVRIP